MSNSFVTPWTIACQTPLSMGFPRQGYWSGLPFPSPGYLPDPGIEPWSPALQADSLLSQFSSVQLLSHVRLFATTWSAARQVSLSISNFQSLLKLMSIELVMPSSHLILYHPFLLLPTLINLSQYQSPSQWVSSSHQMAKVLDFQLQQWSFQWIFRTGFL